MKKNKGFTLLEVVVVAVIVSFISGMVLFNSPQFRLSTKMNSAARQLSFAFRDAEARSTAVRQFEGVFPENYGVHVESAAGSNTYLVIFSDLNADNTYSGTTACLSGGECVKLVKFEGGVHISSIKDPNVTALLDPFISDLDVIFRRPYPSIYMYSDSGSKCLGGPAGCLSALGPFQITLSGPPGSTINDKIIKVWTTGQVSIN